MNVYSVVHRFPDLCGLFSTVTPSYGKIVGLETLAMANRVTIAPDKTTKSAKRSSSSNGAGHAERERVFYLFRRWGFYEALLDPLGYFTPLTCSDLEGLTGEYADEARRIYCGTIGAEFLHISDPARRTWIAERMEGPQFEVNQPKILERLVRADLFEQVLQSRYLGSKRFSLEGETALIPLLDSVLDAAGELRPRRSARYEPVAITPPVAR